MEASSAWRSAYSLDAVGASLAASDASRSASSGSVRDIDTRHRLQLTRLGHVRLVLRGAPL